MTMTWTEDYFREALTFLLDHCWVHDLHLTKFLESNVWENIPPQWCSLFSSMTIEELNQLPFHATNNSPAGPPGAHPSVPLPDSLPLPQAQMLPEPVPLPDSLSAFLHKSATLSLGRDQDTASLPPSAQVDRDLRKGMSPKKLHEVEWMASLVHQVAKDAWCNVIVDVGSGLGYLGHVLHKNYGWSVIGLESCAGHSQGAQRRAQKQGLDCSGVRSMPFLITDEEENADQLCRIIHNIAASFEPCEHNIINSCKQNAAALCENCEHNVTGGCDQNVTALCDSCEGSVTGGCDQNVTTSCDSCKRNVTDGCERKCTALCEHREHNVAATIQSCEHRHNVERRGGESEGGDRGGREGERGRGEGERGREEKGGGERRGGESAGGDRGGGEGERGREEKGGGERRGGDSGGKRGGGEREREENGGGERGRRDGEGRCNGENGGGEMGGGKRGGGDREGRDSQENGGGDSGKRERMERGENGRDDAGELRACLVGLHCCGDLTPAMLRLYRRATFLRALVCVSCCYHKMQPVPGSDRFANFPMSTAARTQHDKLFPRRRSSPVLCGKSSPVSSSLTSELSSASCGSSSPTASLLSSGLSSVPCESSSPVSSVLSSGVSSAPCETSSPASTVPSSGVSSASSSAQPGFLTACSLRLAAQETRTGWARQSSSDHSAHTRHVAYRSLLHVFLTQRSSGETSQGDGNRRDLRRLDYSSFENFVESYVTSANILDEEMRTTTRDTLKALHQDLEPNFSHIEPFTVILQPVLETLVVRDRQQWLTECGLSAVVRPVFHQSLSPRNLALVSAKHPEGRD